MTPTKNRESEMGEMKAKVLHPDDAALWARTESLIHFLAASIGETCVAEPKRRPLADGAMGLCYHNEKRVSVMIRCKSRASDGGQWWRTTLDWKCIAETCAHEVAHLRHPNHGPAFRALEAELIARAESR